MRGCVPRVLLTAPVSQVGWLAGCRRGRRGRHRAAFSWPLRAPAKAAVAPGSASGWRRDVPAWGRAERRGFVGFWGKRGLCGTAARLLARTLQLGFLLLAPGTNRGPARVFIAVDPSF